MIEPATVLLSGEKATDLTRAPFTLILCFAFQIQAPAENPGRHKWGL
jgi:hypothetical protein